jgi:hypothetical protein
MRWTRGALLTRALILRTAKSCGPDAPTLASSFAKQFASRRWQQSPVTGESAEETVKTIAQGRPVFSGEPVVTTLVCFFNSHARLRVQRAPGFPCALYSRRGDGSCIARALSRRENAEVCPHGDVIARSERDEAIHTLLVDPWIASLALAMTKDELCGLPPNCHRPRRRAIQYSRGADEDTEKPRLTGYPACAGYDGRSVLVSPCDRRDKL